MFACEMVEDVERITVQNKMQSDTIAIFYMEIREQRQYSYVWIFICAKDGNDFVKHVAYLMNSRISNVLTLPFV